MQTLKYFGICCLWAFGFLVAMFLWGFCGQLVSAKNDVSVVIGVFGYVVTTFFVCLGLWKISSCAKKKIVQFLEGDLL